jgi:FkbM family methyltransferase
LNESLLRLIRSGLGALGLEIRRKRRTTGDLIGRMYGLRSSMKEVLEHLVSLGLSPAAVIDVGVAYGTPALYAAFPSARHLLIEPLQEFEPYMQDICAQYNAEYLLAAASAKPGKMEIGVTADLTGSSLMRAEGEKREVPVVTLDNVCRKRGLTGPFVVKVDVQGAELSVLDGSSSILKDTELAILEVSFFRFADGFPELYDVVEYMKTRGFVVYEIFGGHNRPLDGARAQTDIAFVKEDGRFRASHAWATPDQTAELHHLRKRRASVPRRAYKKEKQ